MEAMRNDLHQAERRWRKRSLFRPQRRRGRWLRVLLLLGVAAALLLVWQEQTLAWLAGAVP